MADGGRTAMLTEDEKRFLDSSTAMRRKREITRERSEESRDVRPRFPMITMGVIGILGVAAAVITFLLFDSFKPYVDAANQVLDPNNTQNALGDAKAVETAQAIGALYDRRGTVLLIILVVTVVIEAFVYFFWVARLDAWRKREKIRARKRRQAARRRKAMRARQQGGKTSGSMEDARRQEPSRLGGGLPPEDHDGGVRHSNDNRHARYDTEDGRRVYGDGEDSYDDWDDDDDAYGDPSHDDEDLLDGNGYDYDDDLYDGLIDDDPDYGGEE